MEILELPHERPAITRRPFDFQGLSDVLFESADLLEEAKASDDPEFRAAALELAVRSLYTASAAIDRYIDVERPAMASKPAVAAAAGAAIVAFPVP